MRSGNFRAGVRTRHSYEPIPASIESPGELLERGACLWCERPDETGPNSHRRWSAIHDRILSGTASSRRLGQAIDSAKPTHVIGPTRLMAAPERSEAPQ